MVDETQSGRHWSKDFVEHLRTVHFALIAVCIAVIVLATARTQSEVSRAHEQLKQIMDLSAAWDQSLIEHQYTAAGNTLISAYKVTFQEPNGEERSFRVRPSAPFLFNSESEPNSSLTNDEAHIPTPESIADFAQAWDLLDSGVQILVMQMPEKCALRPTDGGKEIPCIWQSETPSPKGRISDFGTITLGLPAQNQLRSNGFADINQTVELLDQQARSYEFTIAAHVKAAPFDFEGPLIAKYPQWKWHRGAFKDAFRELASISSQYMSLKFKQAEGILDAEEKRSSQSFDAFGVKFPAELAIRWGAGAALILLVQLYFWAHLFEFRKKLGSADEGWNVAWVGVYETKPARMMLYSSLLLLPLAGALAAGIRGLYITDASWDSWLLLIGTGAATVFLSILTCFALPRKKELIKEDLA